MQDRQDPRHLQGWPTAKRPWSQISLLGASRRQRRELVNLPIIASLKETARQLGGGSGGGSAGQHLSPSNYSNSGLDQRGKQFSLRGGVVFCFQGEEPDERALEQRGNLAELS